MATVSINLSAGEFPPMLQPLTVRDPGPACA